MRLTKKHLKFHIFTVRLVTMMSLLIFKTRSVNAIIMFVGTTIFLRFRVVSFSKRSAPAISAYFCAVCVRLYYKFQRKICRNLIFVEQIITISGTHKTVTNSLILWEMLLHRFHWMHVCLWNVNILNMTHNTLNYMEMCSLHTFRYFNANSLFIRQNSLKIN